jgi:hypothetical protein
VPDDETGDTDMADTSMRAEAAAVADTATWAIDANTLKSLDQQETNFTKGDEVYVASIAFRSTPGVTGSTHAWFHGGLVDIDNVHLGETHSIPNGMGRVTFGNVTRVSAADVAAGHLPELVGTITIVFESDRSPDNAIDSLLTGVASDLRPVLAGIVEPLSLGSDLASQLAGAGAQIQEAVAPTVLQQIKLFIVSGADPDDLVAARVNVFAAVDDALAPLVDDQLGDAIPDDLGVGGALRPRTYSQDFEGGGAKYRVSFTVSK